MKREWLELKLEDIKMEKSRRMDIGDIDVLSRSISRFGILHPIIIDRHNRIVAGSRRYIAAKKIGIERIPVLKLDIDLNSIEGMDIFLDENICRKPLTSEEFSCHLRYKTRILKWGKGIWGFLRRVFAKLKGEYGT